MSGPLRSKQGCWTCRLRKKKCDEAHPCCSTCESLSITCYGFGPKPDWMDNGERERAVANSLKEIVKHTSRRKVTAQSSKQRVSSIRIAAKTSNDFVLYSSSGAESSPQYGLIPSLSHGASQENGINMLQDGSANSPSSQPDDHLVVESSIPIAADESVLLMNFLDNVFPLQYPIYKPGILEGGRGWLLALLLRTKPLYHAALAFGAYHRRTIILEKISHTYQVATLVQQEKHLEICLKSVTQFAQNSCPNNGLGIVTAVIQLLFFELFTDHGNVWQTHLRAAMNMYQQGYNKNLVQFGLAENSTAILLKDLPLSECEPVVAGEVVNFRFLGGTIIWLDIISSVTAGTAPYLLPHHFRVFSFNSQTRLEDIMGCGNWVMLQIGRIAALHEHKIRTLQQETFDAGEFQRTVHDIGKEIQCGLAQDALEGLNLSEYDSTTVFNGTSDQHTLVTRIFTYMASLYLHLVAHGFQQLEVVNIIIFEAIKMLQTQISTHLLPVLICPLYVIGSIARHEDEQFFRNIFSTAPVLDPLLKHRRRILPILEEVWRGRRTTPGFSWKDSLELSRDILLV